MFYMQRIDYSIKSAKIKKGIKPDTYLLISDYYKKHISKIEIIVENLF